MGRIITLLVASFLCLVFFLIWQNAQVQILLYTSLCLQLVTTYFIARKMREVRGTDRLVLYGLTVACSVMVFYNVYLIVLSMSLQVR